MDKNSNFRIRVLRHDGIDQACCHLSMYPPPPKKNITYSKASKMICKRYVFDAYFLGKVLKLKMNPPEETCAFGFAKIHHDVSSFSPLVSLGATQYRQWALLSGVWRRASESGDQDSNMLEVDTLDEHWSSSGSVVAFSGIRLRLLTHATLAMLKH